MSTNQKKVWFRVDVYKRGKKQKFTSSFYPTKLMAQKAIHALNGIPFSKRNVFPIEIAGILRNDTLEYGGYFAKGPFIDKKCNYA